MPILERVVNSGEFEERECCNLKRAVLIIARSQPLLIVKISLIVMYWVSLINNRKSEKICMEWFIKV